MQLIRNMKHYVISRGLLPPPQKQKGNLRMSVFVLYPLQCPPTFPLSHRRPPPVLTLACLSGLLPCIPPFPVWPLSQEVAQLVDKHHGGDEEEGVREVPPPTPHPPAAMAALLWRWTPVWAGGRWLTVATIAEDRPLKQSCAKCLVLQSSF